MRSRSVPAPVDAETEPTARGPDRAGPGSVRSGGTRSANARIIAETAGPGGTTAGPAPLPSILELSPLDGTMDRLKDESKPLAWDDVILLAAVTGGARRRRSITRFRRTTRSASASPGSSRAVSWDPTAERSGPRRMRWRSAAPSTAAAWAAWSRSPAPLSARRREIARSTEATAPIGSPASRRDLNVSVRVYYRQMRIGTALLWPTFATGAAAGWWLGRHPRHDRPH